MFIGCAWCNLFIYKHGSVNSADKHEEHSRPASVWVEIKCLKMKLPNHFSVYVTNEKWPKDWCNKWDSHFHKNSMNTLAWKRIY